MKSAFLTTLAVGIMSVASAGAADKGFYVGGSLAQIDSGVRNANFNFSDRDSGYKLIAGFRPLDLLAIEANYVDLGKPRGGALQASTQAVDAFVLGFLPIPVVDVFGKVGLVSWKTAESAPGLSFRRSGSDLALGAGVQLHFGSLAARLEYESLNAQELAKPSFISLGLTYTFL
jgi:hypothetical protein